MPSTSTGIHSSRGWTAANSRLRPTPHAPRSGPQPSRWSPDRLTGVVDWIEACVGPPEIDVGHCRLNLTVLFSADVADRFREMYQAESGHSLDAWWDIHALLSYGAVLERLPPDPDRWPRGARRRRDDESHGG